MSLEPESLTAVLAIGHRASIRSDGISLRDALKEVGYTTMRPRFGARDLLPLLKEDPHLVEQWQMFSEDKRTSGGWYLDGLEIGKVSDPNSVERFASVEEAAAEFIVRELDFWSRVDGTKT